MARRQVNVLYAVIATVAASAAAAWFAGSRIESPADVAARTAPPAPSPILVPVEQRVLSSDIVTRGTVRFGSPQPISVVPSPLKGAPGLVTTLPQRNTPFAEGGVLLTASGRPVFLLEGKIPTFRDLGPGLTGEDVRQLEQGLRRLGFDPGPVDGVYDAQTAAAVAKWYSSQGWEPFGPTREQLAAIRALERERDDALRARVAAQTAAASAAPAVASARAAADQSVRAALLDLATRIDERRRLTEPNRSGSPIGVESERARAAYADRSAAADVETQVADRALIVLDPRQPETARMAADAKLAVAQAARQKVRLEGEIAVQTAEREAVMTAERVRVAEAAVRAARLEGDRAVRAALDAQRLADFDVKLSAERAAPLIAELETARRKLGVQVPADEIVFLRNLPVRVEDVTVTVGGNAVGPVMTVTDNQLTVDASLALDAASLVKPGMRVAIDESSLGVKAGGVVRSVASAPGTHGVDGFHIFFDVLVDPTPAKLDGVSVRLTIPTNSTQQAVTAVPVSAVSLAADGTSRVQVEGRGGFEYLAVKAGMAADGYVEVNPVAGQLTPGQMVVVGYKAPERDAK